MKSPRNFRPAQIAPMMDWTDRHRRAFLRLLSPRALLYTELATARAIRHGNRERLLRFDLAKQPVARRFGARGYGQGGALTASFSIRPASSIDTPCGATRIRNRDSVSSSSFRTLKLAVTNSCDSLDTNGTDAGICQQRPGDHRKAFRVLQSSGT